MKPYHSAADVWAENWARNPVRGDRGGVYMVTSRATGELLYIGQTCNLRARLCPSVHPVYREELHDLHVLFVENRKERGYMEGRFIQILKPSVNVRNGLMPKQPDALVKQYYDHVFNQK